ncbi:MAG TPA: hypothetical protein VMF14_03545 [Solirubrobacteraceae bacterium]|nr:hypothetical protein [Solirubrobacteraceae bacterium]
MNTDFDEATWVAERLPDVDHPDGLATDRARLALLEHISAAPPVRPGRRRRWGWRLVAAGGIGAAAVAGVVAVGNGPAKPARTASTPTPTVAVAPQTHVVHGHPVLLRLASDVTQAPAPPGNATLVVRHHTFPDASSFWGYDLYEDDGAYYYGATLDELHQSLADPSSADKELGGILTAAAGSANLTPAEAATNIYRAAPAPSGPPASPTMLRKQLTALLATKPSPAEARALRRKFGAAISHARASATTASQGPSQATVDNYLWGNCMDALEGGAGRADIRAGAMLALSTLPDVHLRQTTFDGHAVVQITNTQFDDHYAETLDLDAHTGVLLHMSGGTIGKRDGVDVTYRVTRVTAPSLDPAH